MRTYLESAPILGLTGQPDLPQSSAESGARAAAWTPICTLRPRLADAACPPLPPPRRGRAEVSDDQPASSEGDGEFEEEEE